MTPDQRFEILKTELSLIQATLDKYDDLIFRGRNFFVTLWLASLGLSFTLKSADVSLLAVGLSLIYWFLEGMMRHQYWWKYVDRYRFLRDQINRSDFDISQIPVYDLTNFFRHEPVSSWKRIQTSFFKLEPAVLYAVMGLAALVVWLLFRNNMLTISTGT